MEQLPRTSHPIENVRQIGITEYNKSFSIEADNPPGGDKCMGAFYTALSDLATNDKPTQKFLRTTLEKRHLTPQHLTNLIFRVFQYVELFEKRNPDYPINYSKPEQWRKEIPEHLGENRELIQELLLTKDTTTTIYQRYAGTQATLNLVFPNQRVIVADFGCGGNYGLPGIIKNIEFNTIDDQTSNQDVTRLLKGKTRIEEGLAIDKIDPKDIEQKKWRIACSFYPRELSQIANVMILENALRDVEDVTFLQADLLNLRVNHANGTLPQAHFDAVAINTVLYQLSEEEREKVVDIAQASIQPNGVVIVQDFAVGDTEDLRKLKFARNWFKESFSYRTFIRRKGRFETFKEFLQWSDGRCTKVRQGKDFEELMNQDRNTYHDGKIVTLFKHAAKTG